MSPIRVVLADDQALVRGALAALLSLEDGIEVVGEAGDGEELVALVGKVAPDVALVDIEMPGMDGIEATRQIAGRWPEVKCLVVTTFGRPGYLQRALEAGARGFVVKETPAEQLADMVRGVHAADHVGQLFGGCFFHHEPACPGLQRPLQVARPPERGHHQTLHLRPPARDLPRGLDPVHAGHLDVHQRHIRRHLAHQRHEFLAVPGLAHHLDAVLKRE